MHVDRKPTRTQTPNLVLALSRLGPRLGTSKLLSHGWRAPPKRAGLRPAKQLLMHLERSKMEELMKSLEGPKQEESEENKLPKQVVGLL